MKRTLFVLVTAALTIGVAVGMSRPTSPGQGSDATAPTMVELPDAVAGGVVQAEAERHDSIEQPDAPILLGKLEITIDMSPMAVKARAETQDVICPGRVPCGP